MTDYVLCSLFDKKACKFSPAVAYPDTASAERAFILLLASGDSTPAQWPDDFDLYVLGTFNIDSGIVSSVPAYVLLSGSAAFSPVSALRHREGGSCGGNRVSPEDSAASAERNAGVTSPASVEKDSSPDLGL